MSKISLSGDAAGTGTFTIASPNTNTNYTLTLPTESGTIGVNSSPTGTVIWFAANTAPTGYLKANGANVSRTTYADLFAAIGTTFGSGDGSTTFRLPDLRGEFIRGWDDGRGVDSGRAFGSSQSEAMAAHRHFVASATSVAAASSSDLAGTNYLSRSNNTGGTDYAYALRAATTDATVALSSSVGGAETRPRNIALLACIKF